MSNPLTKKKSAYNKQTVMIIMDEHTVNNVVDLSSYDLTVDELNLLSKGMNFFPTPLDLKPGDQ